MSSHIQVDHACKGNKLSASDQSGVSALGTFSRRGSGICEDDLIGELEMRNAADVDPKRSVIQETPFDGVNNAGSMATPW
jgi:hypothetical protein